MPDFHLKLGVPHQAGRQQIDLTSGARVDQLTGHYPSHEEVVGILVRIC
jgi:hypothetical protein